MGWNAARRAAEKRMEKAAVVLAVGQKVKFLAEEKGAEVVKEGVIWEVANGAVNLYQDWPVMVGVLPVREMFFDVPAAKVIALA